MAPGSRRLGSFLRLALGLSGLALAGCPSATSGLGTARASVEWSPSERAMLDDLTHHRTTGTSMRTAALMVGGAGDPNELASLVRTLDPMLGAAVANLPEEPAARARALLTNLFAARGGRALLQHYDARASTLYDVLQTGRFNCVAATTLYLLAAERAGVDARPVLLPSHARAVVVIGGRRFVVETTTPYGFDAPPAVSREAQDRARPRGPRSKVDLYSDEKGTEVDWNALLAVTYGNLGIAAQERGDTALAASLVAREAALTPPAQAPIVRMQQASLLGEMATRALGEGKFDAALALAERGADAAPDAPSRKLLEQNIAAIASQQLVAEGARLSDANLAAFAEPLRAYPSAYGDVRALVLTLDGERRLGRGDVEGSAVALREAAKMAHSDEVRGQAGHNARLGELNRLTKLSMTDPDTAWAEWQRLGPADPAIASFEAEAERVIKENRAIRDSNAGECAELEKVLTSSPGARQPDALRASCREKSAIRLSEHGETTRALEDMRLAVRLEPGEARHRQNLSAMLQREIDRLVRSSHCDMARPLIAEGHRLDPGSTFFADELSVCGRP